METALQQLLGSHPQTVLKFLDASQSVWILGCRRDGLITHLNTAAEIGLGAAVIGSGIKSLVRADCEIPRVAPGTSSQWSGYLVAPGQAWAVRGAWFGLAEQLVLLADEASRSALPAMSGSDGMHQVSGDMGEVFRNLQEQNVRLAAANRSMTRLVTTDTLTRVGNRRMLEEAGPTLQATVRDGGTVALAMTDLDHFKAINDTFGHKVGDEVLVAFATVLTSSSRSTDVVVRWGGEEFVIAMPGMDEAHAASRLRALTQEVAKGRYASMGVQLTVSAGVGVMGQGESLNDALHRVDEALYRAKTGGRNRVERAGAFAAENPSPMRSVETSTHIRLPNSLRTGTDKRVQAAAGPTWT